MINHRESIKIEITKAEWDLRAGTKFLRVDGPVMVNYFDDEVIAEQDEEHVGNEKILTINITINPSGGEKQPQPLPFHFVRMTDGEEPWSHGLMYMPQIVAEQASITLSLKYLLRKHK